MSLNSKQVLFIVSWLSWINAYSSNDSWTQKTSLPGPARVSAVAFSILGFGYVGTGQDSSGVLLDDFWQYDPINDSWSQVATFSGTARKNAVAFVIDSFAYVGTGYSAAGLTHDFYRYDPGNNSWLQVDDLDSAGAVYPRRDAGAFTIGSKGYVVGGYDGTSFYSRETWEYDPLRDTTWKERTSFPIAGRRWATSFALNGVGYAGMGFNYSQEYFSDFWKFDPVDGSWTQVADFPGSDRGNAGSFVINDFAFVGTGFDGAPQKDFYVYDGINNTWGAVLAFGGNPTSSSSCFSLNGKGYLFGGVDSISYRNELWEYTPDNTLSVGDVSAKNEQVTIFPVPATDWIRFEGIDFNISRSYQINLFDAFGKMVVNEVLTSPMQKISLLGLPDAVYFYQLKSTTTSFKVTGRLLLQ